MLKKIIATCMLTVVLFSSVGNVVFAENKTLDTKYEKSINLTTGIEKYDDKQNQLGVVTESLSNTEALSYQTYWCERYVIVHGGYGAYMYRSPEATSVTDPGWDLYIDDTFVVCLGYTESETVGRRYIADIPCGGGESAGQIIRYYIPADIVTEREIIHSYGDVETTHPHRKYCDCGTSMVTKKYLCSICYPVFTNKEYVINFKLNGGKFSSPIKQTVKENSLIQIPDDPVREGYIFDGWYTNKDFIGLKWFNTFNSYKGYSVTSDMTLYAKWTKVSERRFEDGYQFRHQGKYFFENNNLLSYNYKLSGDYYDVLLKDEGWQKVTILKEMFSRWGGSCMGLSTVAALVYSEKLDTEFFQSDASCLYELDYPKDNKTVWNLINYYQMFQYTKKASDAAEFKYKDMETFSKDLLKMLDASNYPVVFTFNYAKEKWGHAIICLRYEESDTEYIVYCYDPNNGQGENLYLYIDKNNYNNVRLSNEDYNDQGKIKNLFPIENGIFEHKNIQEELIKLGYENGAEGLTFLSSEELQEENVYLTTNYNSFTIRNSKGEESVVENGEVIKNTLNISEPFYLNIESEEMRAEFSLPTMNDGEYYEIIPTDEINEYKTSLSTEGNEAFCAAATCEKDGIFRFYSDGSVSMDGEEDAAQAVMIGNNSLEVPWLIASVESVTTDMNVTVGDDRLTISVASGDDFAVEVMDEYDTVSFDHVDNQGQSYSLGGNQSGKVILVNDDTYDFEEKTIGNALIFYSMGGSLIDAQNNIPSGNVATKPEDPIRAGYIFEGWYTEPTCSDGNEWNFDTPITQDTRIYAKWSIDDNFTHTVTFKGNGEVQKIVVFDGETLENEQIPEVPYREGYIGEWNISDFSEINFDMVACAVYDLDGIVRISGTDRYATAYKVADAYKEEQGIDKFEAVVVATGKNFADALAGSYLAVQKNAPILLTNGKADNIAQLHEYIKANVASNGTVYILGGEGAVPASVENISGYTVKRIAGSSRYDTNIEILKEAGIRGNEIIVATGKSFADSLSASAAKLPILLVKPDGTLNNAQKTILANRNKIYIIGGEGAVSKAYEAELAAYGAVERVFGKSRYETSVAIANTFFDGVDSAVVASGKNFPDGLCGGPLAAVMDAPLILTKDGETKAASGYVAENAVTLGNVLGGDGALKDDTVADVFNLKSVDEIILK